MGSQPQLTSGGPGGLPTFGPPADGGVAFSSIVVDPLVSGGDPPPGAPAPHQGAPGWLDREAARFSAHMAAAFEELRKQRVEVADLRTRIEAALVTRESELSRREAAVAAAGAAAEATAAALAAREAAVVSAEVDLERRRGELAQAEAQTRRELEAWERELEAQRRELSARVAAALYN